MLPQISCTHMEAEIQLYHIENIDWSIIKSFFFVYQTKKKKAIQLWEYITDDGASSISLSLSLYFL